jgi:hypothetical protein
MWVAQSPHKWGEANFMKGRSSLKNLTLETLYSKCQDIS